MAAEGYSFEHAEGFEQGELAGQVTLGKFEAHYEEIFAEVIEDGVITPEERARLHKAADALGLDRVRLRSLEEALQAAYEARHHVRVREVADDDAPPASIVLSPQAAADPRVAALVLRVRDLEAQVAELTRELSVARSQVAVEVDLSNLATPAGAAVPYATEVQESADELARRLRSDSTRRRRPARSVPNLRARRRPRIGSGSWPGCSSTSARPTTRRPRRTPGTGSKGSSGPRAPSPPRDGGSSSTPTRSSSRVRSSRSSRPPCCSVASRRCAGRRRCPGSTPLASKTPRCRPSRPFAASRGRDRSSASARLRSTRIRISRGPSRWCRAFLPPRASAAPRSRAARRWSSPSSRAGISRTSGKSISSASWSPRSPSSKTCSSRRSASPTRGSRSRRR